MTEIVSFADIVKDIGIPALFFIVIIYLIFKTVPAALKSKQEADAKQQEYYSQRQKQYDDQMREVIRIAEQGTQAIVASNAVIADNSEVIKQNTVVHSKVIEALDRDLAETKAVQSSLTHHDGRAEKMQVDLTRLIERSNLK